MPASQLQRHLGLRGLPASREQPGVQARDGREIGAFPQRFEIGTRPRVLALGGIQITGELLNMTGALREVCQEQPVPDLGEVLAGVGADRPRLVEPPAHRVHDAGHLLGLGPDAGIVAGGGHHLVKRGDRLLGRCRAEEHRHPEQAARPRDAARVAGQPPPCFSASSSSFAPRACCPRKQARSAWTR